jgi:hypothetical protein
MSEDWGNNVSRTLSALKRQFDGVVWQVSKPPLDSELNLMSQMDSEKMRQIVSAAMPSGFIITPTIASSDYTFNQLWSNRFLLGKTATGELEPSLYANINGWIIPLCGTRTSSDAETYNVVALNPPPVTQSRIDFVFLEAWTTLVAPNPATANKPTFDTIYKYGNVEYGGTNITDDLEDTTIGFETTERVQIQYRLRVFGSGVGAGQGVALNVYPDGLDDPNVLGQGTATAPVAGVTFANMRQALGDPGLWRAGDGDPNNSLGTTDGYVYAIPVCAIFRRNSDTYVAANIGGNPNHNGSFNRNPLAVTLPDGRAGAAIFVQATLGTALPHFDANAPHGDLTINVTNMADSVLSQGAYLTLANTYIMVEDEILSLTAINVALNTITIGNNDRGRYGTDSTYHAVGTSIDIYNNRPDGKFADQIDSTDVLDLRKSVTYGEWDYTQLLSHNFASLARGSLRTAYKQALGESQGVSVMEVDYAYTLAVPNYCEETDAFDGIRTIFSDSASLQPEVTLLLDNEAVLVNKFTSGTFVDSITWDVQADFQPTGYMNNTDAGDWTNGSMVFLHIGGTSGSQGARTSFKNGEKAVRFVSPYEYWNTDSPTEEADIGGNQAPVKLTFIGHPPHEEYVQYEEIADNEITEALALQRHPGPMYPYRGDGWEFLRPFIFLGGVLNSTMAGLTIDPSTDIAALSIDFGAALDFDAAGVFYSMTGSTFDNDPTALTQPLYHGQKTLYGMLTNDGRDQSGYSSQVFVTLWGDTASRNNNGAFQVIGAGTVGYTAYDGANANSIYVRPLTRGFAAFDVGAAATINVEFRSMLTHSEDGTGSVGLAAACLVLTDIQGSASVTDPGHPWDAWILDTSLKTPGGTPTVDYSIQDDSAVLPGIAAKMKLDLTLQYAPGRGGQVRIPDEIARFAAVSPDTTYLRQAPGVLDTTFNAGPLTEAFYDPINIQFWNRIGSRGWNAPTAPEVGGLMVSGSDIDREHELFMDRGSKTLLFRPFRKRAMTLQLRPVDLFEDAAGGGANPVGLFGVRTYATGGATKDHYGVFTTEQRMGYEIPPEFMPRFGRQDIPYYQDIDAGTGAYLDGINHLFCDTTTVADFVFNVVGGQPNAGAPGVTSMFFTTEQTVSGTVYCDPLNILGPPPSNVRQTYRARKKSQISILTTYGSTVLAQFNAIASSDLGTNFDGIQLPPYMGPARLYGVYEYADFIAQGGVTFQSDRITPEAATATNLLKKDADQQTLYILQNGAKDMTDTDGDHTYIIPANAIDFTKSPNYTGAEVFDDFDYVVECVVFGFSKNWINGNNYVLARRYTGDGTLVAEAALPVPYDVSASTQLEGINTVIPAPAASAGRFYTAFSRTVYQGDPFMTRDGHTQNRLVSDYENRYGQIANTDAISLATPITQLDASGDLAVTLPNLRSYEILASFEFYTTMGTGNIGGSLYPGTCTDVGYIEDTTQVATRIPSASTDPLFQTLTRAFTEGQRESTNHAMVQVEFIDGLITAPSLATYAYIVNQTIDIRSDGGEFDQTFTAATAAAGNNQFQIATKYVELVANANITDATLIPPGDTHVLGTTIAATGAVVGEPVTVTNYAAATIPDHIVLDAYVSAADVVTVRAKNIGQINKQTVTIDFAPLSPIAPNSTAAPFAWAPGVPLCADGDGIIVNASTDVGADFLPAGLVIEAFVIGANAVEFRIANVTVAPVAIGLVDLDIHIIENAAFGTAAVQVVVHHEIYDVLQTALNFATRVQHHPNLLEYVDVVASGTMVSIRSTRTGASGNSSFARSVPTATGSVLFRPWRLVSDFNRDQIWERVSTAYFSGGEDIPVNAGTGMSQIELTGMTERLPLGILLNDSDFLCENPLRDSASAFAAWPSTLRPKQNAMPVGSSGDSYSRFMGAPGELVAHSDGAILRYVPKTVATPTGASCFRNFRGGGGLMMLSGDTPGGPIDWLNDSFPAPLKPVLKGGILAGKAMLVRNYPETAFAANNVTSHGDEVQMVVLTYGLFGDGSTISSGITISGEISPTGYGEGYAGSDRYRIEGMPLVRRRTRAHTDPENVEPALYLGS